MFNCQLKTDNMEILQPKLRSMFNKKRDLHKTIYEQIFMQFFGEIQCVLDC